MRYFVREELDKPIKGIYDDLGTAIENAGCYKIYDEEGELIVDNYTSKDYIYTFSTTDYMKSWEELKAYYENELHIIKMRESEGYLFSKISEKFYKEILDKMDELESQNTKIIGGY